tara:strand:- start:427 stop:534 length:108 start_codon:yes stop_codon:yes gene_type:complete
MGDEPNGLLVSASSGATLIVESISRPGVVLYAPLD